MGERQISENGSAAESHSGDARKYDILILGASYGSLLATKILLSGHNATLTTPRLSPTSRHLKL